MIFNKNQLIKINKGGQIQCVSKYYENLSSFIEKTGKILKKELFLAEKQPLKSISYK